MNNSTRKYDQAQSESDLNELEWLFNAIDLRVLPAVTIIGLLLQSLNVVVLLSKQLRNNAVRFLAAMSLVDVLFLIVQIPFLPVPFIARDGIFASRIATSYYEFFNYFYTPFVLYPMSRVCLETNTWLAVLVSFERYLALQSANNFAYASRFAAASRKLSLPAIFAAFLLALALNVNSFFGTPRMPAAATTRVQTREIRARRS